MKYLTYGSGDEETGELIPEEYPTLQEALQATLDDPTGDLYLVVDMEETMCPDEPDHLASVMFGDTSDSRKLDSILKGREPETEEEFFDIVLEYEDMLNVTVCALLD